LVFDDLRGALAIGQDRPVGTGTGLNYRHKETVCAGGNECQVGLRFWQLARGFLKG